MPKLQLKYYSRPCEVQCLCKHLIWVWVKYTNNHKHTQTYTTQHTQTKTQTHLNNTQTHINNTQTNTHNTQTNTIHKHTQTYTNNTDVCACLCMFVYVCAFYQYRLISINYHVDSQRRQCFVVSKNRAPEFAFQNQQ